MVQQPANWVFAGRSDDPGWEGVGLWLAPRVCHHVSAATESGCFTVRIGARQ
jgi:hypothetical protein